MSENKTYMYCLWLEVNQYEVSAAGQRIGPTQESLNSGFDPFILFNSLDIAEIKAKRDALIQWKQNQYSDLQIDTAVFYDVCKALYNALVGDDKKHRAFDTRWVEFQHLVGPLAQKLEHLILNPPKHNK